MIGAQTFGIGGIGALAEADIPVPGAVRSLSLHYHFANQVRIAFAFEVKFTANGKIHYCAPSHLLIYSVEAAAIDR
jgi:hypothetical protein